MNRELLKAKILRASFTLALTNTAHSMGKIKSNKFSMKHAAITTTEKLKTLPLFVSGL